MNPVVYIDGELADMVGAAFLRRWLMALAERANVPVDMLTSTESVHHGSHRFTAMPAATKEAMKALGLE